MPRLKLTKRSIDGLPKVTKPTGVCYYDSSLPGFGIRVYPSGKKTFFIEYGPENRRRRMTIGPYGPVTLHQAREKAKKTHGSIIDGDDPLEKRSANRQIPSFGDWVNLYLEGVEERKKSPRHDRRYLTSAARYWRNRPLDTISQRDVKKALKTLTANTKNRHEERLKAAHRQKNECAIERLNSIENPGNTEVNRFLASLRACFEEAVSEGSIEINPAAGIKPKPENTPRAVVLSKDQMARLVEALKGEPDPFVRAAFHLLIETGARKSEVLRAKWEHFDLEGVTPIWKIPSPKAGRPQVVPLLDSTVNMLRSLPRLGPYVIPGRNPETSRSDLKRPWQRLKLKAGLDGVNIHDLRRTFGLHITRTAGLHVASKLLRHSDVRITERVYAPLDIEELRGHLENAKSPAPVVKFPLVRDN